MKWIDFLEKIQLYGVSIHKMDVAVIIDGKVDGEKKHITLFVEDMHDPIDTQDATRILQRFGINEMIFHDHHRSTP